jgi:hypothetical protein
MSRALIKPLSTKVSAPPITAALKLVIKVSFITNFPTKGSASSLKNLAAKSNWLVILSSLASIVVVSVLSWCLFSKAPDP